MYDYQARYYDPTLGRFIQADTIVPEPGNPQALNRYAYAVNNPLRYTDPSGHSPRTNGNIPPISVQSHSLFNGKVIYDAVTYSTGTSGVYTAGEKPTLALLADLGGLTIGVSSLVDVAEVGITIPFVDELISLVDVGLAALGSHWQGETYKGKPHPDLPTMTVLGQDVIIAGGDLIIGLSGDVAATALAGPTEGISFWVGETIMELPSAASFFYDVLRALGNVPTEGAWGYYRDDQGILHIVSLDYVPAETEAETTELGTQ